MSDFQSLQLHANINKALAICGYTKPTPIQGKAIPAVLAGKDVAASAQTGTGKTAAFVLPALNKLLDKADGKRSNKPRILILTPTRELATQINKAATMYGKFCQYNIISLLGGMPYGGQIKDLARGADIIVATPGRLMDHMEQKRVDLSSIEMLILDEADRMLDMGFIDDVQYIAKFTPQARQTLLFSATLDNKLMAQVRHLLKNPVRIDLSNEKLTAPSIKQELYRVQNMQHKNRMLKHFLNDTTIYKAIIFSATKINADKIADQLRYDGFPAAALHGDLRQNVRNRTIDQLRRGKIQFLVATDVAARGIDISDITHVINYDIPRFCEDYVHRIGRTGRAGKEGVAISFVMPTEMKHLQQIERYIGQRLNLKTISNADLEKSLADAPQREFAVFEEPEEDNFKRGGGKRGGKRPFKSFDREKEKARAGYEMRRENKFDDRGFGEKTKKPRYDHENEYRAANFAKDRKPKRQFESLDRDADHKDHAFKKPKREFGSSFGRDNDDRFASKPRKEFHSYERDDSPRRAKRGDASGYADKPQRDSFDGSRKPRKNTFNRDDANRSGSGKRSFSSRDARDSRDVREARSSRDTRDSRDVRNARDSRDARDRSSKGRDEKRPFSKDSRGDKKPFASRDTKEGRFAKKRESGTGTKQRFVAKELFGKDKKNKRHADRNA